MHKFALIIAATGSLAACQPTTQTALPADFVPECQQPHDDRDRFIAQMLAEGDSPETIAQVREAWITRGSVPEESSSYRAFYSLLTGAENPDGPESTANYAACFARFS